MKMTITLKTTFTLGNILEDRPTLVEKQPFIHGQKVFSPGFKIATVTKGMTGPLVSVCYTN